jgi:hypothetical protein
MYFSKNWLIPASCPEVPGIEQSCWRSVIGICERNYLNILSAGPEIAKMVLKKDMSGVGTDVRKANFDLNILLCI